MITLGNLGSMAAWVYVIIQQDEPIRHRMVFVDAVTAGRFGADNPGISSAGMMEVRIFLSQR